jgi:hypothetical protein
LYRQLAPALEGSSQFVAHILSILKNEIHLLLLKNVKAFSSIASFRSITSIGVNAEETPEQHFELFHSLRDPVTKGPWWSMDVLNWDAIADDVVVNPIGGSEDIVGNDALNDNFGGWGEVLVSLWWDPFEEFVQADGILHVFINVAVVVHKNDKSETCNEFNPILFRKGMNADGKVNLIEFYNSFEP